MHIDHDHVAGGHEHPHTHEHIHTHDHPHDHDHLHDAQAEHDHPHTPKDELLALMKYMVGHNAAHAKELAELAQQLKDAGGDAAYEKVMSAVADFEKGNQTLSDALKDLQ